MQKTRPRRTGKQTDPATEAERTPGGSTTGSGGTTTGKGRATHVRNRLVVAVAVVAAAIAGAGLPSVLAASGQLSDSQDLVTLAGQTQNALVLAHSLADERDEVTSYIAAGRPKSKAPGEQASARVDRQVEELRSDPDISSSLRGDLDGIAAVRRSALTGKSSALEAHGAYSSAITELHRLAGQLAERMPPRAGSGAYSLAELDSAVQQSAAARGLLVAALGVPSSTQTVISPTTGLPVRTSTSTAADAKQRDALTAAAQQARLRSDAALADFRETAPGSARDSYDSTVTGPEVDSADKYLGSLTDQPTLSTSELDTSASKVNTALSARIDAMRGAESALYDRRTKDLAQLRDDDVSALELRIAVLGVLMLVAVGIATAMARSLTRPLSVLRRGSARLARAEDPAAEEPVTFTGRNDEFAQVVRSVNALHAHAAALHERIATLETDRKHLVGQRQKMADAREELRSELTDSAVQLERLRESIGGTFVNLALRTLGLVERQLGVIEGLEEREHDPDRLATLFKLDHFATVMRRHSENLLVLAGTEHVQQSAHPVPLVDVVRAAVSEIERYERVRIAVLPPHAHIAGFAADDLSHLLAELMENATTFSPPDMPVEISGWLLENGEVMLSVQDEGIGMAGERMSRLNARLAEFDQDSPYDHEGEEGLGLGLYVVARLAHRHGVRVQLREQKQGGVAAVVVLPNALLAAAPSAAVPAASAPVSGSAHSFSLPGADAEANSNELHARHKAPDPLVALAERAAQQATDTPPDEHAPTPAEAPSDALSSGHAPTPAETPSDMLSGEHAPTPSDAPSDALSDAPSDEHAPTPAETTMELLIPLQPMDRDPRHLDPNHPGTAAANTEPAPSQPLHPESAVPHPPHPNSVGLPPTPPEPASAQPLHPEPAAAQPLHPEPAPPHPSREEPAPPHPSHPQPAVAGGEMPPPGPPAPDDESVTGGTGGNKPAEGEAEAEHQRAQDGAQDLAEDVAPDVDPDEEPVTAKGLPKRTPKITAPTGTPPPRPRTVNAEALRRRLGGFSQGAQAGYRHAEAEIAERTARHEAPATEAEAAVSEEATGGTVEEASS